MPLNPQKKTDINNIIAGLTGRPSMDEIRDILTTAIDYMHNPQLADWLNDEIKENAHSYAASMLAEKGIYDDASLNAILASKDEPIPNSILNIQNSEGKNLLTLALEKATQRVGLEIQVEPHMNNKADQIIRQMKDDHKQLFGLLLQGQYDKSDKDITSLADPMASDFIRVKDVSTIVNAALKLPREMGAAQLAHIIYRVSQSKNPNKDKIKSEFTIKIKKALTLLDTLAHLLGAILLTSYFPQKYGHLLFGPDSLV